jgi:hypothetical protein
MVQQVNDTTRTTRETKPAAASLSPLPIKSLPVALDFPPSSRQALDYDLAFARQFKAKLTLQLMAAEANGSTEP